MKRNAEGWFRKQKKRVDYDIRLFDNREYMLAFTTTIPANWLSGVAKYLLKKSQQSEAERLNEFEVDERLNPRIVNKLRKHLKEVEEQVRKDINTFRIHTIKVEKFNYKKNGDNYDVDIRLRGHYGV